jgi:DNA repair exonuclease SbcCD ATPase subunit
MSPFGLFRKKEKSDSLAEEMPLIAPAGGPLSIREAQDLLENVESAKLRSLASRLSPVKESADRSLRIISELANDMENEKIKFEDVEQRFKSVVENSRRTIVLTLRREGSTELELPQSVNDAKRFREKFEAMMNRLGEISSSHRKMLNTFMKKNANKMRDEFDRLRKLLDQSKSIVSDFEREREPIVKCGNLLNTATQKVSSIHSGERSIQVAEQQIAESQKMLERLKNDLGTLKESPEFLKAKSIVEKIREIERRKEELRIEVRDLFAHVSRAFTKYSYGVSRDTEARLLLMSEKPWTILNETDISSYSSLLTEVRKSIGSGKIQLKDSEKMLHYLDAILHSLPEFHERGRALRGELDSLRTEEGMPAAKANELDERIAGLIEDLDKQRQALELQKRQNDEKRSEVESTLKEASSILSDLADQRYSIRP